MTQKDKQYICPNCDQEKPDYRERCPNCGYEDKKAKEQSKK